MKTPPVNTPAARQGKVKPGDSAFMQDLHGALLTQSTPGSMLVLYLIIATLLVAGVWASVSPVEEVTKGQGKVIPASHEQVIQSLEGGILEEMNVREGDIVQKGQILLKIDATRAASSYREGMSKVVALEGAVARLRAESYGLPLNFPDSVKAIPSIVRDETKAYESRKKARDDSIAVLRRSLSLSEKEITMSAPLVAQGLMSEVELLRMKRQSNDFQLQISERETRYRSDANDELAKQESELAQIRENVVARHDMVSRTSVVAPVKGTVKNIRMTTIGGVITQGADILEIVPLEDNLLVEAKVNPADVAFLRPGLKTTIKLTAYDYGIYGGLEGKLEYISPDTLEDEKNNQPGKDTSYYRILVRSDTSVIQAGGKLHPIIPGMTASVEIKTGEKTILSYLLKPLLKGREAFRER